MLSCQALKSWQLHQHGSDYACSLEIQLVTTAWQVHVLCFPVHGSSVLTLGSLLPVLDWTDTHLRIESSLLHSSRLLEKSFEASQIHDILQLEQQLRKNDIVDPTIATGRINQVAIVCQVYAAHSLCQCSKLVPTLATQM